MKTQKTLEHGFYMLKTVFWLMYFVSLIGVWAAAPAYLHILDNTMKILVAITLIYFFNPWKKTVCTNFHRQLVFTSAMFLFFSVSFTSVLQSYPSKFANIARNGMKRLLYGF